MPHYEEPNYAPFYAGDLTKEDLSALRAFFEARVKELADEHPVGSNEARAARALEMSVGVQIDELGLWFEDEEPETLTNRMSAWNHLVFSVWPWEGVEGFDATRWRLIRHRDLDSDLSAARHRVQQLEARAEKRRAELDGR
ncbi:hypothetical protein [Streptomyces acidiscabies]|uniref:Uncharacterized protein n=1 Tax=Streptomyces acidiscabies TaxID=42234 RepID=A0ABU4MFB9_9ACTN|nr:hypothetical protein [Streptomyces acidiscabies]MDX3025388.1 hypothetical protein [Streptomyces acidiscabies]